MPHAPHRAVRVRDRGARRRGDARRRGVDRRHVRCLLAARRPRATWQALGSTPTCPIAAAHGWRCAPSPSGRSSITSAPASCHASTSTPPFTPRSTRRPSRRRSARRTCGHWPDWQRTAPSKSGPRNPRDGVAVKLVDHFQYGLNSPICLTWELTYACNLACVHCLSSSGRRDPRELTTAEAKGVIDELQRMRVFYVNIGGGEPTVRPDFWELLDYAVTHELGVKFSTNGSRITPARAEWLRGSDYVDVQISLDGATAAVNDRVRGAGSYATALRAMELLAGTGFKLSVVVTRENAGQLDAFKALADSYGATLRLTRLRPSGRGADVWDRLHPTAAQQRAGWEGLGGAGGGGAP